MGLSGIFQGVRHLVVWAKQLLEIQTLPEVMKVPDVDPFDENEQPISEIDHTGDDPGPDTMPRGELRPI